MLTRCVQHNFNLKQEQRNYRITAAIDPHIKYTRQILPDSAEGVQDGLLTSGYSSSLKACLLWLERLSSHVSHASTKRIQQLQKPILLFGRIRIITRSNNHPPHALTIPNTCRTNGCFSVFPIHRDCSADQGPRCRPSISTNQEHTRHARTTIPSRNRTHRRSALPCSIGSAFRCVRRR